MRNKSQPALTKIGYSALFTYSSRKENQLMQSGRRSSTIVMDKLIKATSTSPFKVQTRQSHGSRVARQALDGTSNYPPTHNSHGFRWAIDF
jgi:hypothetical protein